MSPTAAVVTGDFVHVELLIVSTVRIDVSGSGVGIAH